MNLDVESNGEGTNRTSASASEGGLRAPPDLRGWKKAWWWFHFVILVQLARLRFIAILIAIGVIITQWDVLMAYYDRWTRSADSTETAVGDYEYFCPMHPTVIRDNAKEKCPICFMPLSKRKKGETQDQVLPAGVVGRVQLSPYRVTLAGVNTWSVDLVPLSKEITAVGYVEFNERGQRNVSARVAGRLDKLFVNETGQLVREGDALASLYSPDLIVSVQNLLDARKGNNQSLEQSARRRLELLGIGDREIDEILQRGKAEAQLVIRSPIGGHVLNKYVREGEYVQEGTKLYEIVDLSTVWIQAQIYEDDLQFLPVDLVHPDRNGRTESVEVKATTRALPNEVFRGKLAFIYPHVDEQTRTATVRFELDNPDHKLRPGSTALVTLTVPASKLTALLSNPEKEPSDERSDREFLAVPESAVIDTGKQQIVYRETLPGTFDGVKVKLGPKMIGPDEVTYFPVLAGLERSDRVVTTGSFLVDAETRLNPAAGSIYFGGSSGSKAGAPSVTAVRPSTPEDDDAKITAALARLSGPDRQLAEAQQFCPILSDNRLGSMGVPVKVHINGETVFLCCDACKKQALAKPNATLAKVAELKERSASTAPDMPSPTDEIPQPPADQTKQSVEAEIQNELAKLSAEDRKLADAQRFCPIADDSRLGSMGKPVKLLLDGKPVFLCCEGCEEAARSNVKETLKKVKALQDNVLRERREGDEPDRPNDAAKKPVAENEAEEREVAAGLAGLSDADRRLAERQRFCAVLTGNRLGSMGTPIKLTIDGQPVFVCCKACPKQALANKQQTLATALRLIRENSRAGK